MAWNVVIAGGGFAGSSAARELERILPKQSARLILVNDVNFMLYTPFLPEAAAGTLEPRHVVTPLRDILKRTNLRLGAITGHDPEARTVELQYPGRRAPRRSATTSSSSRSGRSRARCRSRASTEHAIGFKSLADAIWLRNHVIETLEQANATEDPQRREELLTYVFVGGGYSGLEALAELQDFAADAMDRYPRARLHGMRWILIEATDRVLPEVPADLADYALRQLRGRGIDIRLGTRIEEAAADSVRLSTGEQVPTRTLVWTAGVKPHPSLASLALPLDDGGRVEVDEQMRVEGMRGVWAIGDCAAVPYPGGGGRPCPPTAAMAVRQGPAVAHNVAAELGVASRPRTFRLPRPRGVRQPRPLQGGRQDRPAEVPRLRRLVDGAHLPHEPDPGPCAQGPRDRRLDRRPAVRARHRRGRLDRPSAPAVGRGLRPRRHPPARSTEHGAAAAYVLIAVSFGLATGIIGRAKGSSFWIWFLVGTVLPGLGLIAVVPTATSASSPSAGARAAAPCTRSTSRSARAAGSTWTCRTGRGRAPGPGLPVVGAQPQSPLSLQPDPPGGSQVRSGAPPCSPSIENVVADPERTVSVYELSVETTSRSPAERSGSIFDSSVALAPA